MNALTLYKLTDEYVAVAERLSDLDLDEQTIADTLEGLSGELETKATNVAMFVRNLESSALAIKEAEATMALRRKAIEARAGRVREYLKINMTRAGISKIECPLFKIALRDNPPSVVVADENAIPPEFMRVPDPPAPAPDKRAIGDALKAGTDVPGAHLERTQRIEIK